MLVAVRVLQLLRMSGLARRGRASGAYRLESVSQRYGGANREPADEWSVLHDRMRLQMRSKVMTSRAFRSSRPDSWTLPRPHSDPSLRFQKHGPIQPMHPLTLWERLLGHH